ncbi:hypothetical protein C8Q76DRAFT_803322 [Earliella scabrosa]|nr:hypothetical protein C8Q76DRAFT_803322 [Earliella scabrosa]
MPLCPINPNHPEDKYLMEMKRTEFGGIMRDPENLGPLFTDRAKAAQKAKWKRLYKKYGPMPELDESMLASSGLKPPLLYYGWPITENFLLEYAKRHQIVSFTTLHGKKLEYAALTPEDLQDKEFEVALIGRAQNDVFKHLGQRSGYTLEIARPFTDQYFCMAALYSNYSMERRYPVLLAAGLEDVVCELDHAIKEVDPDTDLQWWYDWNNNLGVFTTYA